MKEKEKLEKIEKALQAKPDDMKLLFTAAVLCLNLGELAKAAHFFEKFLSRKPDHAEAHNLLGVCYYESGQLERSRDHYEKATKLDSKNGGYFNNLGAVFLQMGDLDSAIVCFKKAQALKKNDALIYGNLGVAYLQKGEEEEAHKAFEKALKIDPSELTPHYFLGMSYERQGDMQVGDLVKVGELVRIYPVVQLKLKNYDHLYSTHIEEIDNETVTISAPMRRGMPIPFHTGAQLIVGIPRRDALYGFHTEIVSRKGGKFPTLKLKRQPRTKRIQRRAYVRIAGGASVSLKILDQVKKSDLPKEIPSKEIREKNISAGGTLLVLGHEIPRHTSLLVTLRLPNQFLLFPGKVTRCAKDLENEGLYEIAISFTGASLKDRDKLVQFVNQRIVELRKKGLSATP